MLMSEQAEKIFDIIAPYVCHMAWCSYQIGIGQPYNLIPTVDNLASQKDAVKYFKENPHTSPEESHNNWMKFKISQGWVYGLVKDVEKKTHPDLIPWNELPKEEQAKDINDIQAKRFALYLAPILAGETKA